MAVLLWARLAFLVILALLVTSYVWAELWMREKDR